MKKEGSWRRLVSRDSRVQSAKGTGSQDRRGIDCNEISRQREWNNDTDLEENFLPASWRK
jgi:hypothetical protein